MEYLFNNWHFFIAPLIYLIGLFFIPKGIWKTFLKFKNDPSAKEIVEKNRDTQIQNEIETYINSLIKGSTIDSYDLVQQKVYKAIDYAIKRHDWYENQRNRIFNLILWTIGFSLTFVGLLLRNSDKTVVDSPEIMAIIITVTIALFVGLVLYNKELDADRPYRLVSDIRFWFFRYNLPTHSDKLKSKNDITRIADEVQKERNKFFDRISENFTIENSIREDFEQLFILHVLQRYKSESLIKLRWLMTYTMIVLIIELFIYFL